MMTADRLSKGMDEIATEIDGLEVTSERAQLGDLVAAN